MKLIRYCLINPVFLLASLNLLGVQVVMSTEDKPAEKPEEEEKEPELPKPARLAFNVSNKTGETYVVTISATVNTKYGFIVAQTLVAPKDKATFATLMAPPESAFKLKETEVFWGKKDGNDIDIPCELFKPEEKSADDKAEEVEEKDKDDKDKPKAEGSKDGKENPKKDKAKPEELTAKKSIDIYLYFPEEEHDVPKCAIKYDSL